MNRLNARFLKKQNPLHCGTGNASKVIHMNLAAHNAIRVVIPLS
jgi:hypothetical protein